MVDTPKNVLQMSSKGRVVDSLKNVFQMNSKDRVNSLISKQKLWLAEKCVSNELKKVGWCGLPKKCVSNELER